MATIKTTFRGINSDVYATRLPSGQADVALNVEIANGTLSKRSGFALLGTTGSAVLAMWTANFSDGSIYLMAKCAGGLYYQKQYPTAGAWTLISTTKLGVTLSTTDPGWSYMWRDRFYHFDRTGGIKWNPTVNLGGSPPVAQPYKAGLPYPSIGPLGAAVSGGEKEGYYHVYMAYRNTVTDEVGVVCAPYTPGTETRLSEGTGGISLSNFSSPETSLSHGTVINGRPEARDGYTYDSVNTDALKYEWNAVRFYTTMGSTEWLPQGAGAECFSHIAYSDVEVAAAHDSSGGSPGLNKADHVLRVSERFTNAGGEPPGSQIGVFTGNRAIYCNVWQGGLLVPDKIMFSLPGVPTAVPQYVTYTQGGDSTTIRPYPWLGECGGVGGKPIAAAFGGSTAAIFTATSTWVIRTRPNNTIYPAMLHSGVGCVANGAAVGAGPRGIYALSESGLSHITPDGTWQSASIDWFDSLLATSPTAQLGCARLGYFSARDQLWIAVPKPAETVARRIIVLDRREQSVVVWEPACLGAGVGIAAMCELSVPGATPVMLIASTTGAVYKYPSGTSDAGTNFAAQWRGWFGQESATNDQQMRLVLWHNGASVSGNVTVTFRALRTASDTETGDTVTLGTSSEYDTTGPLELTYRKGKFFQLDIQSANTVSGQWVINDMAVYIKRDPAPN